MILDNYKTLGGVHPETASIKNIFAYHGIKAPHSGKRFSEAMLLGIGGGLGTIYMLWEFEKHGYPSLVVGFRNQYNYPVKFLENLCDRLGATTQVMETTGQKKAADQLDQTLAAGDPAIVWVDLGGAPYYMHFLLSGVVVVYGHDEDKALVDNRAKMPYILPADLLTKARAKVPSYKNRLMVVKPSSGSIMLKAAIHAGLADHMDFMNASSTSFALPAIRKWARMMTDTKNKKGWPTVFAGGRGLYGSLRTLYEGIEHAGTGGGGLRGLYADFLDEAAGVLDRKALKAAATLYRDLQGRWRDLAQAALPDRIDVFKSTRELLDRRAVLLLEQGSEGLAAITPINDTLHQLKGELNDNFPLNASKTSALFADLQSRLEGIYEGEKQALAALEDAVDDMDGDRP